MTGREITELAIQQSVGRASQLPDEDQVVRDAIPGLRRQRVSALGIFARRYGGQCRICGVVRDYHDFFPRDHAFESVPT